MRNITDYIFYKMYKFYGRFKTEAPIGTGIMFLFINVALILFFLAFILNLLIQLLFNQGSHEFTTSPYFLIYYVGILFISLIYFILRYTKKQNITKIVDKYGQEGKDKFKTWQIFLIPIIIIGLWVLLIFLEDKFGLITITRGR